MGNHLEAALQTEQTQHIQQSLFFGETIGDIPVYSLHRIRRLLKEDPPQVSREMQSMLIQALLWANQQYRAETGNKWNCLTSHNLAMALERVNSKVKETIRKAVSISSKRRAARKNLYDFLQAARKEAMKVVRSWFEKNYEDLLYDMDSAIPWPVVMALQDKIAHWVVGENNPFTQDIETAILQIAKKEGMEFESAKDAWEAMGGTLFSQ